MKGTFGVAVLAAALHLAAGASATPPPATNLNVTAAFSNGVSAAGTPVDALSDYCPPISPGSGCTATPAVQVRWGRAAVSGGQRSGLGFAPTAATAEPLDTSFVVGTLTHFNFPIVDGASSVDLSVHLTAHTATDGDLSFDLPFTLGIVETPNTEPCPFRAQPTDPVCPDAIDLPAGGVHVDLPTGSGTAHPHTYTLNVIGFTTAAGDLTHPVSRLITQENAATQGFLVASISRDNVTPVAADDTASTTSGGSTTINAVANDTDADADALAPVIVTAPGHGTATVSGGTITYTANSNFAGTDHIAYAASDGFSQSAPADIAITVADTTDPTITVPSGGVTAEATGPEGAAVTYLASASDNVDGAIPVDCRPPSGSTFTLGKHTVRCTATDAAGNTTTQTFDVTVRDTTAPTLAGVPSDKTAEATGPGGAPVTYTLPTATDAADRNPTVDCQPPSGSTFHLGGNTVTCTATDASGNHSSQTFAITVQDTTAPTVTVPSNMTVFSAGGSSIPVSYSGVSASDLVDGSLPATCSPASGATFPVGTTTVACTATDVAGNTGSASFTVTVVPNRPPVCSAVSVQGLSGLWPVNHKLVLVSLTGATDPDGNTFAYRIDGVTQDEPVSAGFDALRASDGSVWLRSERLGTGDGRVYTIAFTVTDQFGLSCSGTVDVTVAHDSAHAAVKSPGSYNSFGS